MRIKQCKFLQFYFWVTHSYICKNVKWEKNRKLNIKSQWKNYKKICKIKIINIFIAFSSKV